MGFGEPIFTYRRWPRPLCPQGFGVSRWLGLFTTSRSQRSGWSQVKSWFEGREDTGVSPWRAICWRLRTTSHWQSLENVECGLNNLWNILACSCTFLWPINLPSINCNSPRRKYHISKVGINFLFPWSLVFSWLTAWLTVKKNKRNFFQVIKPLATSEKNISLCWWSIFALILPL